MKDRGTDTITENDINIRNNLKEGGRAVIHRRSRTPTPLNPYIEERKRQNRRRLLYMIGAGAVGGAIGTAALTKKYWLPHVKRGLNKVNPYLISARDYVQNRFHKAASMFNRTAPPQPSIANMTRAD